MQISKSVLKRMPEESLSEVFRDGVLNIYGGEPTSIDDLYYPSDECLTTISPVNLHAPEFGTVQKTFDKWGAAIIFPGKATWFRMYSNGTSGKPLVWIQGSVGMDRSSDLVIGSAQLYLTEILIIGNFEIVRAGCSPKKLQTTKADTLAWAAKFKEQIEACDQPKTPGFSINDRVIVYDFQRFVGPVEGTILNIEGEQVYVHVVEGELFRASDIWVLKQQLRLRYPLEYDCPWTNSFQQRIEDKIDEVLNLVNKIHG